MKLQPSPGINNGRLIVLHTIDEDIINVTSCNAAEVEAVLVGIEVTDKKQK